MPPSVRAAKARKMAGYLEKTRERVGVLVDEGRRLGVEEGIVKAVSVYVPARLQIAD